ncbi:hypothetical protein HN873_021946 [Arachis hypogaea]
MQIALFVSSFDVVRSGWLLNFWLLNFLKGISVARIKKMQQNLSKYSRHFLYSSLAQPLVLKTWFEEWFMAGKVVNIKLHSQRSQRVVQGSRNVCTCECRPGNVINTISIVS